MKGLGNKKRGLRTAFTGLVIGLALILVACGGSSASNSSTPTPDNSVKFFEQTVLAQATPTVPSPTPHTVPHFKVGKVAKINGWEITIGGSHTFGVEMVQQGAYEDHKASLEIGVEIKNTSSDGKDVAGANWQFIDLNGHGYSNEDPGHCGTGSLQSPGTGLASEQTVDDELVYCPVPESVHQYQLLFAANPSDTWGPDAADAIWDISVTRVLNKSWPPLNDENVGPYLTIPNLQDGNLSNSYIRGKIVVVDKNGPSATDFFSNWFDRSVLNEICSLEGFGGAHCPVGEAEKLIANNPTEVGTIIWLDCIEKNIGSYSPRGTAYQTTCVVTIIDKAKALIVGNASFGPTEPPTMIDCAVDTAIPCEGFGPVPYQDIAKYILSLPRM